jgi:hypothetical protein
MKMNRNTAVDMDDHNNNHSEPSAEQLELAREHARAEKAAAERARLENEGKKLESEILTDSNKIPDGLDGTKPSQVPP